MQNESQLQRFATVPIPGPIGVAIMHNIRKQPQKPRSGFSLIELMIVIVVIGILMALLLPVIGNARRTARVATVRNDIANIEAVIAKFKLDFGMEPPSRLFLVEDGVYDLTDQNQRQTVANLRQLWPNFNPATAVDFDASGVADRDNTNPVVLTGSECLVFFLVGPRVNVSVYSNPEAGFSKNPTNPFAGGGSRTPSYLDYDPARLVDVDGDGFNEMIDQLPGQTMPYIYLSSNGGRGYLSGDAGGSLSFPYYSIDTNWPDNAGSLTTTEGQVPSGTAQNAKTVQIISPGFDGEYGVGGLYETGSGVPIWEASADANRSRANRKPEEDNITNFSEGELGTVRPFIWDRE